MYANTLISRLASVPSAASFYVPTLPGLHQDHPLHIYAGHVLSDPNAASASSLDVLAHLFFVMVKARRAADKERLMFWFNVSLYNPDTSPEVNRVLSRVVQGVRPLTGS